MNQIAVGKYFRLILLSILFLYRTANAQQAVSSEEDLKKQADKAFSSEKYDEALSPYSQLLSLYPSNSTYNYRYGVALLQAGKNKANAVSYLEIAAKDAVNPQEVWIYLGQSYMIIGKFEDALGCFQKFESIVNAAMLKKFNSDELKANCRNAIELLKSRKNVAIISKKDVARNEFYKFFDWSNANGKIVPAAEQFLTTKDKDNQLNPVMFIANDRQTIYLSSFGKKGDKGKDIYIIRKMPNGDWSQPENLGEPINTEANEDFPYLDRDGRTLYFSSKSKASIGGYDIFKSKFDFNTGKWSTPENLGWPINTISDDYLYVPDQKGLEANYATAVSSLKNEIEIRRIQIPDAGQSLVTISGYYAPLDQKVRRDARITILRSSGEGIITSVYTDPTTGKYEVTLEPGQDYVIVVEGGGYLPHAENFNLPSNVANSDLKQIVKLNRDRSNESLTLENYFYPASAVRDVPSEVKTASFDAEIDSTSLMAVQINNQTVMVTKPGTGKQDVETAAVPKANQVNIEKKDGYDPTLEKTSADEVRQKLEEEGRAKEVADEGKKSSEYDVNIGNEELASIAIIDAKTAREEADSLNREVVRLNAGAIERDSLSAQFSAKAEVATEQEKPTYLNEAYVLKAEADNMRRQAADLQVAAMAKDSEAKASEQEANALLATINSGKGKNTAKANLENKDKTQPSLAKTEPALFEKSKSEDKNDANEIKELSPSQTPVVKDESPASKNVSESTVAINTPVESGKSGVNSTEKNDDSAIEKSKPAEKSAETISETETAQKVAEPPVTTTENTGSPNSGKATSETVSSDKIQENTNTTSENTGVKSSGEVQDNTNTASESTGVKSSGEVQDNTNTASESTGVKSSGEVQKNTNTASESTGVKSSGEVQENKNGASESAGVKTSGDTHDEIVEAGVKSDTPNAGFENSGAQPTTENTTGNLKTENDSEPAVVMTPNSGAVNSTEKKSESDAESKITDTKSEVVENVANSPAEKSTQTVTGEKQSDSVPTTPVVENKKSTDVDGKSSEVDGNKVSAVQQTIADNNKIESKNEDRNTVNNGQDGTNKAQENSEPIVSHEKSSTENTPLAVTENKVQKESEKLKPGATEKNENANVDTKVAGVTSEVVSQNDKKEIANSTKVDSKKDEAPVANVEHDETISSKNNEPVISEQKVEQTTDVAENAATEKGNTTANKIEDSVAENTSSESLSETSSETNSTSEKIKTNDGQVSSDKSITERTNAPADQNVPSSDNSVTNKEQSPAGNAAKETPSTVTTQNELADNFKESGKKDSNLNAGDSGNSASTNDSIQSDTHISQVELKPPFVVPTEEKKTMPDNINTLKLYPVSEEARIAYQAFKSKYKNSKQLSDQSIELQNRISKTKPSAERDSMIMVSNILSEQSSEQYLEAVNQLKAAETIDPDVKHKMEMNEQIVAYNSSMPAGSKGKDSPQLNDPNDTANTVETNNAVTDDQQIARVGDEKAGDNVESPVSENTENRSVENNETPVAEVPAENVSNEASTELTAEEAKALDEATTFTVETPNGKEVVKIDTTGIDTRHPEFQNYVEINKAITGKQVETIDVFAAAVNKNKIAVEQKQEQNRLMDKAEVEQDRPTKAQLFIQADAMRDSSKKNEAEAAEKFALAQQKTNEVKSKTAEMQEIRKRIAIPGRDLPAQATKSIVKPLGLTEEEVLAMTKSQSATESASSVITPTSANGTTVPTSSFTAEKVEQFAQKSFSISNSPVYSKENPIPMNPPIPDGLVFKVQIGAFRNEIAAEKFQGVQPITAETTRPGWIRYCVGLFQTFEPAVVVKKEMQQRGFKDAFVVAYLNGKRIGLEEAYAMIGKGKSTPDQTYIQQSQTEMALLRANNIRPENIASIRKNLIDDDEKSFYGENASAVKKSLAAVEYAVQVGVYKTSLVPKGLQSLMPLFTEKINASLYRFTSDHYSNYASADSMKRIARREGVKDAFIVVYRNGVQSSLASVPLAERTVKPAAEVATAATTSSDSKSETVGSNLSVTSQPVVASNSSNEKIIYRVQLGAFKNNIPFSSVVTFLNVADKGITQVTDERGLHIFYAGTCDDFSTASTLREEIVGKGVTDAFVVAIRDGKRIVITDEMKLKK